MKFNTFLIKRKTKFFFQRLIRGWDDSDTWSLDASMAKFMVSRLKRFKELKTGYPPFLKSVEAWDLVLDELIWMFEYKASDEYYCDANQGRRTRYETAKQLFVTYYDCLWW